MAARPPPPIALQKTRPTLHDANAKQFFLECEPLEQDYFEREVRRRGALTTCALDAIVTRSDEVDCHRLAYKTAPLLLFLRRCHVRPRVGNGAGIKEKE